LLGSAAFITAYVKNAGAAWEGIGAGVALAGLSAFALIYAQRFVRPQEVVDEIAAAAAPVSARDLDLADERVSRRTALHRLAAAAVGALACAALVPLRSFAPARRRAAANGWAPGVRVVREDGTPIKAHDVDVGSATTIFPQHMRGDAGAQATLLRVEPSLLALPPERATWTPLGCIAYSRVCTHVGCPVALYRAASQQLFCPCHQSTFDVVRAATPVSGPAERPLPQLPLVIDREGYLAASGGFSGPVGPG